MDNFGFAAENDNLYRVGRHLGFLSGFLLFASMLFFILSKFRKVPLFIKYYHVVLVVIAVYITGSIIMKSRK